jgi:hypothetical protein
MDHFGMSAAEAKGNALKRAEKEDCPNSKEKKEI